MKNLYLKPLNENELEWAKNAFKLRKMQKCWYVLKYDIETTQYNNEIVFKNFFEAFEEFENTYPSYTDERIELIFSPEENDTEFSENIVVNYKYNGNKI